MIKVYRDGIEFEALYAGKQYTNIEGHTIERFTTMEGNLYFVTLRDSHYCAHGKTVAQAVADAKWKDPEQRPSMESVKADIVSEGTQRLITLNQFRILTGACAEGCRMALERSGMGEVTALTAYDIRDRVSREWGSKLLEVLEFPTERECE